jgi:hypothetical protein
MKVQYFTKVKIKVKVSVTLRLTISQASTPSGVHYQILIITV